MLARGQEESMLRHCLRKKLCKGSGVISKYLHVLFKTQILEQIGCCSHGSINSLRDFSAWNYTVVWKLIYMIIGGRSS